MRNWELEVDVGGMMLNSWIYHLREGKGMSKDGDGDGDEEDL